MSPTTATEMAAKRERVGAPAPIAPSFLACRVAEHWLAALLVSRMVLPLRTAVCDCSFKRYEYVLDVGGDAADETVVPCAEPHAPLTGPLMVYWLPDEARVTVVMQQQVLSSQPDDEYVPSQTLGSYVPPPPLLVTHDPAYQPVA